MNNILVVSSACSVVVCFTQFKQSLVKIMFELLYLISLGQKVICHPFQFLYRFFSLLILFCKYTRDGQILVVRIKILMKDKIVVLENVDSIVVI